MKINSILKSLTLLLAIGNLTLRAQPAPGGLDKDFLHPPDSARPWVYWFWLNGNITSNGITADLEAMKRVGIGGVLIMEVDQGAPLGPVPFMSATWRELFKHVVAEAQRLGLEVNMNNDAGWNGSGGPWIKPEESMQELTWTETELTGPQRFEGVLPQPKTAAGYYRDIIVQAVPSVGDERLPGYESKAAFQRRGRQKTKPGSAEAAPTKFIERNTSKDLTAFMDKTGKLTWDVPPGKWTVLRLGHTSTGVENLPAHASGRGLECDKLSRGGIEANFAGMMKKLAEDSPNTLGKSLVATHIDSWENGSQNWTARMREEFRQRRGYDMTPLLPVMTGRVIESAEISERFLWDVGRTISELVIENYAGHMRRLAAQHGMRFTCEAYGSPCDYLPYGGQSDEPMGEFWIGGGAIETCRGMASAGHVYGKRIIGAEAFTADNHERWKKYPGNIKALGDQAFCEGINRFVFHRYALQPWATIRNPGMTMGPWGLHYERSTTWWEWTRPWHEYLARCQLLLRQGIFVADICYLQAEASPQGFHNHKREGYDWDECSADAVLTRMTVKNGRLVLPDGLNYRVLVLPESRSMTPALLRGIKKLVEAGATVIGPPPVKSPSLADYPQCDAEVKKLAGELWGKCDGKAVKEHRLGKGRVVWGVSAEQLLAQEGVPPDFSSRAKLRFIHRATSSADLYFVANPQPRSMTAAASFRTSGKIPELWQPDTGRIERAAVFEDKEGVTRVLLPLEPSGSVFVVFREKTGQIDSLVACSHEGQALYSVSPEKPSRIVLQKAAYGIPADAQRTRDVRARVQRIIDSGARSFTVSRMAEGDDPATNLVKSLVVEYTIDGKLFTVVGQDPETIHLTGEVLSIVVTTALYGVLDDPNRTRDMRAKVQRMADGGETSFQVARMAEDGDPAFGIVKTLVLEYTLGGKSFTNSATDPETIDLVSPQPEAEPAALIHSAANGRAMLEAWKPGHYELETASGQTRRVDVPSLPVAQGLTGPWEVHFDPKWGGPDTATFNLLEDWSKRPEDGIRFYSGKAVYRKTFTVSEAALRSPQSGLYLDLGKVAVMARVKLNDKDLGILWKPPFRVNVTDAVKPGENTLEVRVVNLWINRMLGDEQLPADSERKPDGTLKAWPQWLNESKPSPAGRFTFTSWRLWKKDEPLQESGLLGPVTLRTTQRAPIN